MRAKKEILEDVQALEIAQLRTENKLLRGNITRLKNILSGRNPMRVMTGNLDEECQELLQIAQTTRQQIESLERKYAESSSNYESSFRCMIPMKTRRLKLRLPEGFLMSTCNNNSMSKSPL